MLASLLTGLSTAALLAATPPASPLEAPQPARARVPGQGRVVQVTPSRVYLDAGSDDGLAVGQGVALRRGEVEVGSCTVERVAPDFATCTGVPARVGDTFKLEPLPAPEVKVVVLPPPVPDEELARRQAAVAAAPVVLVEDQRKGPASAKLAEPRSVLGEASLTDAYWGASSGGSWDVARLDAAVHGAPLGPLTVDLDVRAERWVSRSNPVFRPRDDNRLYVWQAQVAWSPLDRPLTVTAGRVLAWTIPGATVMDGAVVGLRREGLEGGLFGGAVPDPATLYPGVKSATAGGYWIWEQRPRKDLVFRQEGRLAWVRSPELGDRVELEATGSVHSGAVADVFGTIRAGAAGTARAPGDIDGARLEGVLRPVPALALNGGFEYGGLAVPQTYVPSLYGTRNRRADLSAFWDLGTVRVGASGGFSRDVSAALERRWVGPEMQWPRFFTPRLSLSAGYLEELGWLRGRSAFLQAVSRPWDRLRLIGRLSWTHESTLGKDTDEAGLSLSAQAELTDRLGLRLSTLVRMGLDTTSAEGGSTPFGVNALLTVYALF